MQPDETDWKIISILKEGYVPNNTIALELGVSEGTVRARLKKLKEAGKKIVVMTNYPYVEGTTNEADAVVCNFSGTPDSIRAAVDVLWGKLKPSAKTKLPIKLGVQQESAVKKPAKAKNTLDLSYC